ncbi:ribokinase [Melghiribacillus thermohalophilus]|uniref:Ribokinase n=1 Tax=Melghiribacillus thermohalophilus TaxID=1324956 RepID=A0A4R3NGS2_9BACI|nr:ribokinase [Melghiribacillus thermohalophilus]TCT26513.1 ribokinase [Melghiribacillus thermohalophilus]
MKKPKITVVGSINMDLVVSTSAFPHKGETIMGDSFSTIPGGKGANQAVAAARLGADVTLIGCVGDDTFGRELIHHLQSCGINTANVKPVTDGSTGVASITIAEKDNSIIVVPGANHRLTPDMIEEYESVIAESDTVLLQLEIPVESVEKTVELSKKHGIRVIMNPAPFQNLSLKTLELVDYITPNEHELASLLTSEEKKEFFDHHKDKWIVTKGKQGVSFYEDDEEKLVPGFRVEVKDTTGAGDTFNGALAVALSKGESLYEACRYGNAAAALSVTKFGAQSGMPGHEEVASLLQKGDSA